MPENTCLWFCQRSIAHTYYSLQIHRTILLKNSMLTNCSMQHSRILPARGFVTIVFSATTIVAFPQSNIGNYFSGVDYKTQDYLSVF